MIYSRCWLTPFQSRNNTCDMGPISERERIDDTEWCRFYEKLDWLGRGGMTDASHPSWSTEHRGSLCDVWRQSEAGGWRRLATVCASRVLPLHWSHKARHGDKGGGVGDYLWHFQPNLEPCLFVFEKNTTKSLDKDRAEQLIFWKIKSLESLKEPQKVV